MYTVASLPTTTELIDGTFYTHGKVPKTKNYISTLEVEEKPFVPPTVAIVQSYQRAFDYFNENLFKVVFDEPLPHAILTFSRSGRGHADAFFMPEQWKDVKSGLYHPEISLVPHKTDKPIMDLMQTLCHEMCHFKDQLDGKPGKNGYHARSWFKFMRQIGLEPIVHNQAKTAVSDAVIPGGAFEIAFKAMPTDISLPFVGRERLRKFKNPDSLQGVRVKYECPSCGINVRGKSGLQIRCETCDEVLHDCGT